MKVALTLCLLSIAIIFINGDYTVDVTPSWGACSGAQIPNSCNYGEDTTTQPVTSIVSWGVKGVGEPYASRVRLRGQATQTVAGGGYFLLANITHDNYLITNGSIIPTQIAVSFKIALNDPSAAGSSYIGTYTFTGVMNVNETLNQVFDGGQSSYCPYASSWSSYGNYFYNPSDPCCPFPTFAGNKPCSDSLTAVLDAASTSQTISPPGTTLTYQMKIAGFCDQPTPDNCQFATGFSFISQEEYSNVKYLFGQLVVYCNPQSDNCQQQAAKIDPCMSGVCQAGTCVFGVLQGNVGASCTPVNGKQNCQTGYTCQSYQGRGACRGVDSEEGAPCTSTSSQTTGPCTKIGCSKAAGGSVCTVIPKGNLGSQCMPSSGAQNSSCSSFTCQTGTGSLPDCLPFYANVGAPCSDSVPLGSKSAQCVTKGCGSNGQCAWLTDNDGGNCGTNTQCRTSTCSNGVCQTSNQPFGSNGGCSVTSGSGISDSQCQTTYCNGQGDCIAGGSLNEGKSCGSGNPGVCSTQRCQSGTCTKSSTTDAPCTGPNNPDICHSFKCDSNSNCVMIAYTDRDCSSSVNVPACQIARCTSSGVCQISNAPVSVSSRDYNSRSCPTSSIGTCQYYGCDGNGNCVPNTYAATDANPCRGKPSNCTINACDGVNTNCVAVPDPSVSSCIDPPNGQQVGGGSCQYGKCNQGTCQVQNLNDGSRCTNIPDSQVGPCQKKACLNNVCSAVSDNNPSKCTPQACTIPTCSSSYQCQYNQFVSNGTSCTGQSGGGSYDRRCAAELCNGLGTCSIVNFKDYTPCQKAASDPAADTCESYHCASGVCTLAVDLTQKCTGTGSIDDACKSFQCTQDKTCAATPDDRNTCTGTGTLQQCHVWGCSGGTCSQVPGNEQSSCSVANPDQCKSYSCQNGNCVGTVKVNASCTYANLPTCNRAYCDVNAQCVYTPIADNGSCVPPAAQGNPCDVRICQSGQCKSIDQSGNHCNTNQDNFCSYSICQGTTCARQSRNEQLLCGGASNSSLGDTFCQRTICRSGSCSNPGNFFDNQTCGHSADSCSLNRCYGGYCDQTQSYPAPAGTSCGSGGKNGCTISLCDGNGQCLPNAADKKPCFAAEQTYKRDATELGQCKAYTCSGGLCTPAIQNVDGIPCTGNFSSPCTTGVCYAGQCAPQLIANCSRCGRFKNCKTCVGGSFADKRSEVIEACRLNPNLAQCALQCSWCGGQCIDASQETEYNTYFPPGSSQSLQCTAKCPAILVVEQSSSIGKALGLGLGLGLGGLLILAILAAVIIAIIIIVKRKANALDQTALQTAFVNNKAAEVNPIHTKENYVTTNQAYDAAT